jgi:hypothetical protein
MSNKLPDEPNIEESKSEQTDDLIIDLSSDEEFISEVENSEEAINTVVDLLTRDDRRRGTMKRHLGHINTVQVRSRSW